MATIIIPTDYPTIQEGIDNATSGDTIKVLEGTYNEILVIDKNNIKLEGDKSNLTKLEGFNMGTGITITASDVEISDFVIRNYAYGIITSSSVTNINECTFENSTSAAVTMTGTASKLLNNFFKCNFIGAVLGMTDGEVTGNTFVDNKFAAIYNVENSMQGTEINLNHISNSQVGIGIINSASTNNTINSNVIDKCEYGSIIMGDTNIISFNTYSYSDIVALQISGNSNNVLSNNVSNNNNGIMITGNDNIISNNYITHNIGTGLGVFGVNNVVTNNVIAKNEIGVSISGDSNEFSDNCVTNNCIQELKPNEGCIGAKDCCCCCKEVCKETYEYKYHHPVCKFKAPGCCDW